MSVAHMPPPQTLERVDPALLVEMIAHAIDADMQVNDGVPLTVDAITRSAIRDGARDSVLTVARAGSTRGRRRPSRRANICAALCSTRASKTAVCSSC